KDLVFVITDNCIKGIEIKVDNGAFPDLTTFGKIATHIEEYKNKIWMPNEKVILGIKTQVLSMEEIRDYHISKQASISLIYSDLMDNRYEAKVIFHSNGQFNQLPTKSLN